VATEMVERPFVAVQALGRRLVGTPPLYRLVPAPISCWRSSTSGANRQPARKRSSSGAVLRSAQSRRDRARRQLVRWAVIPSVTAIVRSTAWRSGPIVQISIGMSVCGRWTKMVGKDHA